MSRFIVSRMPATANSQTTTYDIFHAHMHILAGILFLLLFSASSQAAVRLEKIKLPPGFKIEIYAEKVSGARSLASGPNGIVFVGSRSQGKVYALIDRNSDSKADAVLTIARGLNSPNGVAYLNGSLYVAEISRVIKYEDIENRLSDPPRPIVVNSTFPKDKHHGWKFIRFGPDGKLYIPVGAPCNVCLSKDPHYATIMRMNPDGTDLEIFAAGIRNTVGFDWNPKTKELWFTDNGRDMMGDDIPPDELNCAPEKGMHFGFPYCHGINIKDPQFGDGKSCSDFTRPSRELGPHVAALGMRFYTGTMFPSGYRNNILIAEHGSWNRSIPIGYRLSFVALENGRAARYEPFAQGWLQNSEAWGRPVDVLVMPDGAVLVSDDKADVVYRISYSKP